MVSDNFFKKCYGYITDKFRPTITSSKYLLARIDKLMLATAKQWHKDIEWS